ncbi:E3 ubiquitin-protein ligase TRIM33-like [Acanthaster planci]|uniref:E3 ubiquitin-protein ligase TRIM33-like n=1 Tax=Acanthaster planci TaxID=133434 RepID=A0A8B7ZZG1_ACAPL|nr:E3 ubiquitin-protein ligase TRIM33-like [Acanthaster planci]
MATGSAVTPALETISRHHLECPICSERFQRPKILDCLHSFCEQCLLTYCNTKHQGCTEIPCPVCQRETQLQEAGVGGMKTNFYLIGLVEEIELQEKLVCSSETKLLCDVCEEDNEVTHRCVDCEQNICSLCCKLHLRFAVSQGHTISTLEDIREREISIKNKSAETHPTCTTHEGEVTRFFCTTCEMLICRDCTVIDHCKPYHTHTDTKEASSTYKTSVTDLFSHLEETLKQVHESSELVSVMRQDLDIKAETAISEVQGRTIEIRAWATAQETRIIDNITSIQKDRLEKLSEYEKAMSLASERIQHSLETAREVTRTAADSEFLSLYATINKDLKLLAGQTIPRVDKRLGFLKFKPSEGVLGDISLGKVVTEGKWEQRCMFGSKGSGPGELDGAMGICARQPDEVAVGDDWNKRVVIYSIDGDLKSTIQMDGYPRGITATRTDNRLVVVEEGASHVMHVKVFDKDNTLAFQFPTVPPSEVGKTAVDLHRLAIKADGTIVVGDTKRMVLTEHSPTDGELRSTIPVKIKPHFLAVECSGRFVISDCSKTVGLVDGNGESLFTIKPTIDGEVAECCSGVCADSTGIYVAMHNGNYTGHVHHYDPQGGFLHCIAQGLFHPKGITFTADGQLAIADYYSVKMYMLQEV